MADGLKLAQMSTLLAQGASGPAIYDPAQAALMSHLLGNGQSAVKAEAEKKARKDAEKKKGKGIFKTVGTIGAIAAAPFTGGASLSLLPTIAGAGGVVDSAIAGDMGGVAANGTDAAMGYMMSQSMPGAASKRQPAIDVSATPTNIGKQDDGFDASFGAKSKPGSVTTTPGQPDPGFGAKSTSTNLAAPAPAPAPATTPSPAAAPSKMSMSSLALPALAGLMAYGASNAAANKKAASRPVRTDVGGIAQRSGMNSAANKLPGEISKLPAMSKVAMRPDGKFNKTPITTAQAKALGMNPEEIQAMRQQGLITDDGNTGVGAGLTTAMAAALLPALMKGFSA